MNVQIRAIEDGDYQDLFEILTDKRTYRYQSWVLESFDETEAFLNFIRNVGDHLKYLVLEDNDAHKVIGACQITVQSSHRKGEIGYLLHPDYYGKGLGTYMAAYLIDYGFDELNLNRIFASTDSENIASYKVMEKVGMKVCLDKIR
ncbi:N-acetyltransferase [Macrococcus hajekii]|uniref:N-acetyltransferase n=1 Tax=Macrococcus hajekii TaxID=198482 RepID=A0A4R6BJB4_9STAP|nr:GNAT family N-acetyltransferase [Macrococcus hajekii]TDM01789.1 N-acetyltransferase [Macrococcus hajekii]GGB07494.1 N-acetyltransferase [Macrococcus hajekii]